MFSLYVLKEPDDLTIRYVGISKNVRKRFSVHKSNKRKESPHKKLWIAKLARDGAFPTCQTLITGMSFEEVCKYEIEMIKTLRGLGHDLTNCSLGGEGSPGVKTSEETRKKQSDSHKGKKHSPEWNEKVRLWHLGSKRSPETCRNISEAKKNQGRKWSPETREKIRLAKQHSRTLRLGVET